MLSGLMVVLPIAATHGFGSSYQIALVVVGRLTKPHLPWQAEVKQATEERYPPWGKAPWVLTINRAKPFTEMSLARTKGLVSTADSFEYLGTGKAPSVLLGNHSTDIDEDEVIAVGNASPPQLGLWGRAQVRTGWAQRSVEEHSNGD